MYHLLYGTSTRVKLSIEIQIGIDIWKKSINFVVLFIYCDVATWLLLLTKATIGNEEWSFWFETFTIVLFGCSTKDYTDVDTKHTSNCCVLLQFVEQASR